MALSLVGKNLALIDYLATSEGAPTLQRDANHPLVEQAMAAGPRHRDGVSQLAEPPRRNVTTKAERPSGQETRPAGSQ
ncbi:hypothetical protein [Streptomyces sp. NPDC059272]|uniref:hypothetical protein n=1 Tax=Streptomyces sp. NPDC059272 TaxID=3346800 RepID=UPI0036D02837